MPSGLSGRIQAGQPIEILSWNLQVLDLARLELRICAKLKGQFPLHLWGKMLASLGHYYNEAVLAPERNAVSETLMPLLLGNVAGWRYPNIWVRTDDLALKGHRPQDFGWLTTESTKGELAQFAEHESINGLMDWADSTAVLQMGMWIRNEKLQMTHPEGAHDDDLVARMICAYVSHRVRPMTDLFREPEPFRMKMRTMADRAREASEALEGEVDGEG